jgi:hypothetical protein
MFHRSTIGAAALAATLCIAAAPAQAFDQSKYPDWKGVWDRADPARWLPAGEKPPLTPEYQAVFDWNTADQAAGGHGVEPSWTCIGPGMPRAMLAYEPMEVVVTPGTTHILISHIHDNRRIYTDGRDWPKEIELSYRGYSIGKWIDTDGDGRYDLLEVETRGFKGPRAYDTTGLPLHRDNKTVVKERIFLDKSDPKVLWDEITTIDNALTRPWTVTRGYTRTRNPNWIEHSCAENNDYIFIEGQTYHIGIDGKLEPSRPGQPPPDLRHFNEAQR